MEAPWELYISYSVCLQWPLKGWSQLLSHSNAEGAKKLEGGSLQFVSPAP